MLPTPFADARGAFLRAFRGLRRLQMAKPALCRTTAVQTRAGARPAYAHRQDRTARNPGVPPSEETRFYRNKLEFTFADRRWLTREEVAAGGDIAAEPALGFHIPGMFDKVLDIRNCRLQPEPSNAIRLETRRFCLEHGYTFYNAREHRGLMRNMVVRTSSTGEVMVIVVFGADEPDKIGALTGHLASRFRKSPLCFTWSIPSGTTRWATSA